MFDTLNVLYVEDDPLSREAMEIILRRMLKVANLAIFEDSADFMARYRALDFAVNLILLDIHIEPHTGIEILEMLRNDSLIDAVPVVALTASVMNEEIQLLRSTGFDSVIAKPIDIDTFPGLLERTLKGESVWDVSGT